MSRRPVPAALLIDHPALALPMLDGDGIAPRLDGALSIRSFPRSDRRRCAAQLLAVCSLAAEFDLWLGRRALERSLAYRRIGGAQAVVSGFPVPLAPTVKRLGASNSSFERVRDAAVDAVACATGLAVSEFGTHSGGGFFLEGHLRTGLDALGAPLDPTTARSLWAYQWQLPEMPESGEVIFWKVPRLDLAERIAGAAWRTLQDLDQNPELITEGRIPAKPAADSPLVLCGRHVPETLTQAERWARLGHTSSVVIGVFPAGWDPPGIPGQRNGVPLSAHLAVAGVALDRARKEVDAREGAFDPANPVDRNALTEAARQRFSYPPKTAVRVPAAAADPVHRVLSLRREGLSAEMVLDLSGATAAGLASRIAEGTVVADGDRFRLPTPPLLRRDPLHNVVAESFDESTPERWLHEALGGGSSNRIEQWARLQLDDLENREVRDMLGQVEPGELGAQASMLLAEACLGELDLAGAREACVALGEDRAMPWRLWIEIIDHPRQWRPPNIDWDVLVAAAPRVAAEAALFGMRQVARGKRKTAADLAAVFERAIGVMEGRVASWYRVDQTAVLEDEALLDPAWCDRIIGRSASLDRFLKHKRAIRLKSLEQYDAAREILIELADCETEPGRLAGVFFDLAETIDDPDDEAVYLVRALRLFEIAGFRHKKQTILFNLAMVNIDQLRLNRAQQRLEASRNDDDTQWALGELSLTLARGDLSRFSVLVGDLPSEVADPRLKRSCDVFRGVDALLGRRFDHARGFLERGGEDGEPWLALLSSIDARGPVVRPARDPWRIAEVCGLIEQHRVSNLPLDAATIGPVDVRKALGIAVADHLLAHPAWLEMSSRAEVVSTLQGNGLDGWARDLDCETQGDLGPFLRAVIRMGDTGDIEAIGLDSMESVLGALGVSGLEFRSEPDGAVLYRSGVGEPKAVVRRGSLSLAALGHVPASGDAWGLLCTVLGLVAPPNSGPVDLAASGTLGIVGNSTAVEELRDSIRRAAPAQLTVLLTGETGVGKELAARAIHRCSGRQGSFEAVNVAALPDTLFEAEMFGVVKGAFTGAFRDRPGVAEAADGGTLFLDEIGELALPLQVKLLRFLDSGEVRRVGSTGCRHVDVRVIAATNRNLEAMVKEGTFRGDLYFRIACVTLAIPPLRERGEDVLLLKEHLTAEAVRSCGLRPSRWSHEAVDALRGYSWPGNVRELRQVVGEALLNAEGNLVTVDHLPRSLAASGEKAVSARRWDAAHRELRLDLIGAALERSGGKRAPAARELGITRQTLLYHIRKLGLD